MGLFENSHFPYTNFHEMNMDKIVETVEDAAGQAGQMSERMTAAEGDIDTLETTTTAHTGQISTLQSSMSTAQSNITSLSHAVEQNTDDIDSIDRTVGEQGVDISRLQNTVSSDHDLLSNLNSGFMRDHETLTTTANAVNTMEQTLYPVPDQITALQSDMGTAQNDISNINTSLSLMDTRLSGDESDIAALDGRLTGAEEEIDAKSSVAIEQVLSAGVKIATIEIDSVETNIYAPTAGSTVVRAQDVPFNNQGVTPAMTAVDCQEAIEELNTNNATTASTVGSMNTRLGTVETTLANLNAGDVTAAWPDQSETDLQTIIDSMASDTEQLELITDNIEDNMYYDNVITSLNPTNRVELANECFVGHTLSNSTKIAFFVPVSRQFDRSGTNPIDNPDSYVPSIQGNLYVRGYNGYLLNNVSITGSQVTSVTVQFAEAGALITVSLAEALSITNGSMVEVSMSNNPILKWRKST